MIIVIIVYLPTYYSQLLLLKKKKIPVNVWNKHQQQSLQKANEQNAFWNPSQTNTCSIGGSVDDDDGGGDGRSVRMRIFDCHTYLYMVKKCNSLKNRNNEKSISKTKCFSSYFSAAVFVIFFLFCLSRVHETAYLWCVHLFSTTSSSSQNSSAAIKHIANKIIYFMKPDVCVLCVCV